MPRHKTFTGRSERVRRMDRCLHGPNVSLNSVSIQNEEIILRETFKCTLNVIPRTVTIKVTIPLL